MYVCICQAVSDHAIRAAVRDGARSMRELRLRLGVSTRCGQCAPAAREVLMTYLHEVERENRTPLNQIAAANAS